MRVNHAVPGAEDARAFWEPAAGTPAVESFPLDASPTLHESVPLGDGVRVLLVAAAVLAAAAVGAVVFMMNGRADAGTPVPGTPMISTSEPVHVDRPQPDRHRAP